MRLDSGAEQGGIMRENATIAAAHRVMRETVDERGGLCACGAHSERPCWRPATELRWPSDPEPTICAEHGRLFDLEERCEESLADLDAMHGWIGQLGAQFWRGEDRSRLDYRLRVTFEDMLREYFGLALQMRAAQLVADQGEGDEPLEPGGAEQLARNITFPDALGSAGLIIEAAAPEVMGSLDKWFIVAAIQEARGKE
jgi:hypothetical protein